MRDRLLKPAIDHRRLGQFLTGDWVNYIPALTIVSASFCNVDEVEGIVIWANAEKNIEWLKGYIELPNGIPSLSTFRRALRAIDPKQFEKLFMLWTKELTVFSKDGGDIVAIDGKTMRGSRNGDSITHIVSAWCSANNMVLGQVKTDDKSNEITAIPELLKLLYLEDCIVTIDAIGCQKAIVKEIRKKKADYVISLKGNQATLHEEVKDYFADIEQEKPAIEEGENEKVGYVRTLDKGHGRIELREYYYSTDIDWMKEQKQDWAGLNGIGIVCRKVTKKDIVTEEIQYFISSLSDVDLFAKAVRGHWGIESVHWSLDVTFKDDANRSRKDCTPQNLAVAKRIALNMVRNEKKLHPKLSANLKRLTASLDDEYRSHVFDLNFKK
jgi:predicted transposase YbfD/YdcC